MLSFARDAMQESIDSVQPIHVRCEVHRQWSHFETAHWQRLYGGEGGGMILSKYPGRAEQLTPSPSLSRSIQSSAVVRGGT